MKSLIASIAFLTLFVTYSQESALDKISKKTCEYLDSDEIAKLDKDQKTIKLGLFIIAQYDEYKEELSGEGMEINFTEENGARHFGERVGMNMVKFCPEVLMALAGNGDFDEIEDESTGEFIGSIISINGEDFSFVQVENIDGIVQNFLWLSNFRGSEKLIANDPSGMKVKVTYKNTECFSPKLKEYIARKEIVAIEYLD